MTCSYDSDTAASILYDGPSRRGKPTTLECQAGSQGTKEKLFFESDTDSVHRHCFSGHVKDCLPGEISEYRWSQVR